MGTLRRTRWILVAGLVLAILGAWMLGSTPSREPSRALQPNSPSDAHSIGTGRRTALDPETRLEKPAIEDVRSDEPGLPPGTRSSAGGLFIEGPGTRPAAAR